MGLFKISSPFAPSGDQPKAIKELSNGIKSGMNSQVLLGVTGSGKTFTMASVIEQVQKPTLVLAHNKTLAAQLCAELKSFFPNNAVEYFVSYYDYYQPEAYIASSDTYIEKDASINDEIDRLRHSATSALRERNDVIIVSSVSCIYSMGDPSEYDDMVLSLREGMPLEREQLIDRLIDMQFTRNDIDFKRGTFRVRGDIVEIIPASNESKAYRVDFFGDEIEKLSIIDIVDGKSIANVSHALIYPATLYAMNRANIENNLYRIKEDLKVAVQAFKDEGKLLEAQRLNERTNYDIEMMKQLGYCTGIENYSRYFDGRNPGDAPFTLLNYFPKGFLTIIDESHVTVPQIRAMYRGDRARKEMLVKYGFRLPSAFDNRPLVFDEFNKLIGQTIYVSATPGKYEIEKSEQIVEQIIRPTGLLDPKIYIEKATGQIDNLIDRINETTKDGGRVLITTLTKKMAEELSDYLANIDIKVRYLHSDIKTLERTELIQGLRKGEYDVLVGINLLREGLDLPEVSLVAILDADKEGFLRSETSLIQTIGRAARNVNSKVVLYADNITDSIRHAVDETNRRRAIQEKYNIENNITPQSVSSKIHELLKISSEIVDYDDSALDSEEKDALMRSLEDQMLSAAKDLDFEQAAKIRDRLFALQDKLPKHIQKPQVSMRKSRGRSRKSTRRG